VRQTTKTVQKLTKPFNKNNRATNWKKTRSLGYVKTSVKMSIQLIQSVRRNITTQTEKEHEIKDVKMKIVKLV